METCRVQDFSSCDSQQRLGLGKMDTGNLLLARLCDMMAGFLCKEM